ncbi:XRE family transcriptional regulator [Companilactobacillus suantsaicola]|uniref:XRE family transcriptional regulator n=1 Tax=Companilactobacillus suantsaicola TaxID=2487723 RepID=A0A4Z0JJD6_9LACO|nr:helix-turn-helix transcriptional regulator [Companilactobacillus suantsaicola]TGD23172.1 XRE family transcriptional regulator [Companilactobacillus suantsaicola]
MDINIFIERRKSLKISQVKLCKGICTQSTLSKFENNGRIPSLAILSKLCERLGLSVDDLYRNSIESTTHMKMVLDRVESELMMESYSQVSQSLTEIKIDEINNDALKMQYYYQKGLYLALTKGKPEDVFFDFAQILDDLDERHQSIFSYLSYIGLGKLYQNLKRDTQAKFFFGKVEDYIDVHKDETFQKSGVNVYLRILTLVFYTAEFLIKQHEFKKSRDLIKRGIKLCSEQHITYYLPRLKLLAAEIAIYEEESYETIDNLLSEALAFAKINQNEKVELRVNALREKYNRENQ